MSTTGRLLYVLFWSIVAGVIFFLINYFDERDNYSKSLEECLLLGASMFLIVLLSLPVIIVILRCLGFTEERFWCGEGEKKEKDN
jgi:hypothetical protein